MSRKTFLTTTSIAAIMIGLLALLAPSFLLEEVKFATPSAAANVMAQTVGVLLLTMGTLTFLVRADNDSPTMRSVLIANLGLQLGLMPIDPLAYERGVFRTLGSFVPNTVLHLVLAAGFAYFILKMKGEAPRVEPTAG